MGKDRKAIMLASYREDLRSQLEQLQQLMENNPGREMLLASENTARNIKQLYLLNHGGTDVAQRTLA